MLISAVSTPSCPIWTAWSTPVPGRSREPSAPSIAWPRPASRWAYIYVQRARGLPSPLPLHLRDLGAPASAGQVFGSADAGAELLAAGLVEPGATVLVVGSAYLREQVVETPRPEPGRLRGAENPVAVIQGFDPTVAWTDLAQASYAISAGAVWVATNTDLTIPRAEGLAPGNGSLVAAVAAATRKPFRGWPASPSRCCSTAGGGGSRGGGRPLVVGDRLDTDIRGGNAAGYRTAAVLTGVDTPESILAARDRLNGRTSSSAPSADLHRPYPGSQRQCDGPYTLRRRHRPAWPKGTPWASSAKPGRPRRVGGLRAPPGGRPPRKRVRGPGAAARVDGLSRLVE